MNHIFFLGIVLMLNGCGGDVDGDGSEHASPSLSNDELCMTACKMKIPKIIHQVWHSFNEQRKNPPQKHGEWSVELRRNHPDWMYFLWDKEKSEEFIKAHYPWFLVSYLKYEKPIQRADAVRYFILDHFGGVYMDFDSQNLRNLEQLLQGFDAVFSEQPVKDRQIANGFMASVPKHPLWAIVFDELQQSREQNILGSTGPYMLTRAIFKYNSDPISRLGVKVFGPKYVFPLLPSEKNGYKQKACISSFDKCRELFPGAFTVEHWSSSWD